MKFFNFNKVSKELSIKTDDILNINCFKKLIDKYKNNTLITLEKALSFIWYVTDIDSPGIMAGLSDIELEKEAKSYLDIEDTWKIDVEVSNCIIYIINSDTAYHSSLKELLRGLYNTTSVAKVVNERIEDYINANTLTRDEIGIFLDYLSRINTMVSQAPKNIELVNSLIKSIIDVEKGNNIARGGKVISNSMIGLDEE